jgi:hypothetical protein
VVAICCRADRREVVEATVVVMQVEEEVVQQRRVSDAQRRSTHDTTRRAYDEIDDCSVGRDSDNNRTSGHVSEHKQTAQRESVHADMSCFKCPSVPAHYSPYAA